MAGVEEEAEEGILKVESAKIDCCLNTHGNLELKINCDLR